MAARRSRSPRSQTPRTEPVAGTEPLGGSRESETEDGGDGSDGDDDDDEPHEPAEREDGADDDEGEEQAAKLESQVEIEAAEALLKEENQAALRAHDALQSKARGGRTSAEQVRKAIEAAKDKVRRKHLVKRRAGVYTAQPLTTINENGERIQCPPFMRLPDSMVARLKKSRDLKRLIESGVLEDLR